MSKQTEKQSDNHGNFGNKTIWKMALEVFSIVLGVLLALAVSEWQENRNNAEKANVAMVNVRAELQSNLKLLQLIYPNNAKVVEEIESDRPDTQEDATVIPGVQMRTSAWQTLTTTGLGNFVDYQLLIELSQLYSMIDVYKQTAYSFIGANMNLAATATALDRSVDNGRFSKNFLGFFKMLVQIEEVLIETHEEAIAAIDIAQNPQTR